MDSINLTPQNFALVNRVDQNDDGVITPTEVRSALQQAGFTRVANESGELTPHDRTVLQNLYHATDAQPVEVMFHDKRVGKGNGQTTYSRANMMMFTEAADQDAPLGTVAQGRAASDDPNDSFGLTDCGPASALYMNDRRIQALTGQAPRRTHAQADAEIKRIGDIQGRARLPGTPYPDGTNAQQMVATMNTHHANAGGVQFHFGNHPSADRGQAMANIRDGLRADPGGVMVSVISSYNATSTSGMPHWVVVTGMHDGKVDYYDPGGEVIPDGANHRFTMPVGEFAASLQTRGDGADIVYGERVQPQGQP